MAEPQKAEPTKFADYYFHVGIRETSDLRLTRIADAKALPKEARASALYLVAKPEAGGSENEQLFKGEPSKLSGVDSEEATEVLTPDALRQEDVGVYAEVLATIEKFDRDRDEASRDIIKSWNHASARIGRRSLSLSTSTSENKIRTDDAKDAGLQSPSECGFPTSPALAAAGARHVSTPLLTRSTPDFIRRQTSAFDVVSPASPLTTPAHAEDEWSPANHAYRPLPRSPSEVKGSDAVSPSIILTQEPQPSLSPGGVGESSGPPATVGAKQPTSGAPDDGIAEPVAAGTAGEGTTADSAERARTEFAGPGNAAEAPASVITCEELHPLDYRFYPEILCRFPARREARKDCDEEDMPRYLSMFCFPNNVLLAYADPAETEVDTAQGQQSLVPTWHSFVMTEDVDRKYYGVCVTIWEPLYQPLRHQLEMWHEEWKARNVSQSDVEYAEHLSQQIRAEKQAVNRYKAELAAFDSYVSLPNADLPASSAPSGDISPVANSKESVLSPNTQTTTREAISEAIEVHEDKVALYRNLLKPLRKSVYLDVKAVHVPRVVGVVSRWPWYDALRCWLAGLLMVGSDFSYRKGAIERYIINLLYEVPLPPPGRLEVSFELPSLSLRKQRIYVSRPAVNEVPITRNYSFYPIFRCLSNSHIVQTLEAVLGEAKVIFVTSFPSMLAIAVESICYLLYPLRFQGICIPVLPCGLLDYLQAPVPYIVGVSRAWWQPDSAAKDIDDACIVDLDANTITYSTSFRARRLPPRQRRKVLDRLDTFLTIHRERLGVPYGVPQEMREFYPHGHPFFGQNIVTHAKRASLAGRAWRGPTSDPGTPSLPVPDAGKAPPVHEADGHAPKARRRSMQSRLRDTRSPTFQMFTSSDIRRSSSTSMTSLGKGAESSQGSPFKTLIGKLAGPSLTRNTLTVSTENLQGRTAFQDTPVRSSLERTTPSPSSFGDKSGRMLSPQAEEKSPGISRSRKSTSSLAGSGRLERFSTRLRNAMAPESNRAPSAQGNPGARVQSPAPSAQQSRVLSGQEPSPASSPSTLSQSTFVPSYNGPQHSETTSSLSEYDNVSLYSADEKGSGPSLIQSGGGAGKSEKRTAGPLAAPLAEHARRPSVASLFSAAPRAPETPPVPRREERAEGHRFQQVFPEEAAVPSPQPVGSSEGSGAPKRASCLSCREEIDQTQAQTMKCGDCGWVVHESCAPRVLEPCPANFREAEVLETFLNMFASLLRNYRIFLGEPKTKSENAKSPTGSSSGIPAEESLRDQFLQTLEPEAVPFFQQFLQSQCFTQFILERQERSPEDFEVRFFDELLKAKANRSRLKIAKEATPFLNDPLYKVSLTYESMAPDMAGIETTLRVDTPTPPARVPACDRFPREISTEHITIPRPVYPPFTKHDELMLRKHADAVDRLVRMAKEKPSVTNWMKSRVMGI